jgi:predicted GNAT family N-acyltransferase
VSAPAPTARLEVREACDERERRAAFDLRRRVFCEEQGVAPELEVDGRDGEARHLVAFADVAIVGTCRLLLDGETAKLGRLAVEARSRGRGFGGALIDAAVRAARASGAGRVALHAQVAASELYARHGFVARGAPFSQAGIEHIAMERRLA